MISMTIKSKIMKEEEEKESTLKIMLVWALILFVQYIGSSFIVIENSPILLHKGLRTILAQLAQHGYNAEWQIISCKTFGLPHLRKRLFIVAYSNQVRCQETNRISSKKFSKIISQKGNYTARIQSEFSGNISWQDWHKTIRSVHHLDDGLPKNILYGLLEAAGDTVSPKVTEWIFSCIEKNF